jgi:hypothetical protein
MRFRSSALYLAFLMSALPLHAQWTALSVGPKSGMIPAITSNSAYVYVSNIGTAGGIYRSSDNGAGWSVCNSNIYGPYWITCMASRRDTLFAGLSGMASAFYVSADSGNSWNQRGLSGWNDNAILLDSVDVFVATSYGIYRSTNMGVVWTHPITLTNTLAIARHNGSLFIGATGRGIRRSTDNGTTWDTLAAYKTRTVRAIVSFNNALCAAVDSVGFVYSTDQGATWTTNNAGRKDSLLYTLAVIGKTLFAGTIGDGVYTAPSPDAVWSTKSEMMSNQKIYCFGYKAPYVYAGSDTGLVYRRPVSEVTEVVAGSSHASSIQLHQNYPNPFNPRTVVSCQLPVASRVTLIVYDLLGREVARLVDGWKEAGSYSIEFDGAMLSSGVYMCRLTAGSFVECRKMILAK